MLSTMPSEVKTVLTTRVSKMESLVTLTRMTDSVRVKLGQSIPFSSLALAKIYTECKIPPKTQ